MVKLVQRRRLYDEGYSDAQIAEATGCTQAAVKYWRHRRGLRPNPRKLKPPTLSAEDGNYIAGFFDADGCVTASEGESPRVKLQLMFANNDAEHLEWIRRKLGYGNIYSSNGRTYGLYIQGKPEVKAVAEALLPYLRLKKPRLLKALEILEEYYRCWWGEKSQRLYDLVAELQALNH